MESQSLIEEFDRSCPSKLQIGLVGVVQASHDVADGFCNSEFDKPEARDLIPYLRRAYVERGLIHIASRSPRVKTLLVANPKGNSARILRCGNICLTASYLGPSDGRVPRDATFRNDLAASDIAQMLLYPGMERQRLEMLRAIDLIYAILCHRGSKSESGVVTQVSIVFVDVNCSFIAEIDLLARVQTQRQTEEVEHIRDEVRSVLRKDMARRLLSESAKGA